MIIVKTLEQALEIWNDKLSGVVNLNDLPRITAGHSAGLLDFLRGVQYIPTLLPQLSDIDITECSRWIGEEKVQQGLNAAKFMDHTARRSSIRWRMETQILMALLYEVATTIQETDESLAREFSMKYHLIHWKERSRESCQEVDEIASRLGLIWFYQAIHAMKAHNISPIDIVSQAFRKYGHKTCRARKCLKPICICGPNKSFGGWQKVEPASDEVQVVTWKRMRESLWHCYGLLNWLHGFNESMVHWNVEAFGEYGIVAFFQQYGMEHFGPLCPTRYFEAMQSELHKEAGDAIVVWLLICASTLSIPIEYVIEKTFELLRQVDSTRSE